ncbi:MAG: peptidyl-alpha-hydroxyglycine alpha-amidating lyase family protein [Gemmatimonadota bacterium]|nr:peptidyl-alpha-hydroxyglycine alpha-amidating lyase family protein [Gemmatimonadota bacterium]MDE2678382.1 peptidyl-alpha-hydroxyglycine alpha-amidating lyase family protein [Gemmatimonadota bacterium]
MSKRIVSRISTPALLAGLLWAAGCAPEGAEESAEVDATPIEPSPIEDPALDLPNPNPTVMADWVDLPDGREWGSTAGVDIDPIDGHIWAYDRCGGVGLQGGCAENLVDPIFKFHRETGEIMASFGAGLFVLPHGIHVDADGNVWVTDSQGTEDKGHQVIKFSPEGEVLMALGQPGVRGSEPGLLNEPCDVITAPNGDIFVSDGHSGQNPSARIPEGSTGRIIKFSPEGEYIMEWGIIGDEPGQFRTPHGIAFDSQGRLFVADRGNHRIQIFDQDGNHLDTYDAFSRISGLFIDRDDNLYAIDSESNPNNHEGWVTGIRIGHVSEDRVTAFIPPHALSADWPQGFAGEGVAVDWDGNVYAAEGPISLRAAGGGLTKYVRSGN